MDRKIENKNSAIETTKKEYLTYKDNISLMQIVFENRLDTAVDLFMMFLQKDIKEKVDVSESVFTIFYKDIKNLSF